jgi:hypothetical protein
VKTAIKLYLDEDALDRDLVKALRARSVDVLTAQEVGLKEASDEEYLNYGGALEQQISIETQSQGSTIIDL